MEFCRLRAFVLLVPVLALTAVSAAAQSSITVAWNANTEPEVTGYAVSWGTRSGVYNGTLDAGDNTQYTFNNMNPDQKYFFVVQAYTDDGLWSLPSAEVSNNGIIVQTGLTPPDNRPDIFWHNKTTGRVFTWHLNGTTVVNTTALPAGWLLAPADWKVAGVGDLNGDQYADILWRHTDGWLAAWFLSNNNAVIWSGYLSIDRVADPAWKLGGLGDTNGDGFADLVWQHQTTGNMAIWYMQNQQVMTTATLPYNVGPNSRWQIATIGDVNKDGKADIVWQTTDAWLAVWLLNGSAVNLTAYLSIPQMPDANWRIKGVARPDATGNPALIWQHGVRGDVALWYLNGATVVGTIKTTPSVVDNLDWVIVGSR
jgi:hypothetical protein